jgi:hypothetical protein
MISAIQPTSLMSRVHKTHCAAANQPFDDYPHRLWSSFHTDSTSDEEFATTTTTITTAATETKQQQQQQVHTSYANHG